MILFRPSIPAYFSPALGNPVTAEEVTQCVVILTLGVLVTKCGGTHVTQADGAFAAAVDKSVTLVRVEFRCCDHLCQLLHVGRLYVHNV